MNEHLDPIFEKVLPALEKNEIKYQIFGGVGIAGVAGKFVRINEDADAFVLKDDFAKTKKEVESLAQKNKGWATRYSIFRRGKVSRDKIELFIKDSSPIFSVMPVEKIENKIGFNFLTDSIDLPIDALKQVKRKVGENYFFTPENKYLHTLLSFYWSLILKSGKLPKRPDIRKKYSTDLKIFK